MRGCGGCLLHGLVVHDQIKPGLEVLHFEVAVDDLEVLLGLVVEVFLELVALVTVVDEFDGLLEGYGDEEADDDGDDVDEEVSPGAGGVVGRVDVEHTWLLSGVLKASVGWRSWERLLSPRRRYLPGADFR
jgi:hypothetical protein